MEIKHTLTTDLLVEARGAFSQISHLRYKRTVGTFVFPLEKADDLVDPFPFCLLLA